ncbi:MAG TPA: PorT family protein [Firmicutes bacterium]|nr:PorT family protein [Bacillota bacterium]
MKKLLIFLVLVVAAVGMVSALELNYGLRTGINVGNMSVDPDPIAGSDLENKMKTGFYCGFWARHMMNEKMGITAELNYVEKGDRYSEEESEGTYHMVIYENVLEFPVLFTYVASEKFTAYAGPVLGYILSGGYKDFYDYDDPNIVEFYGINFGEWLNRFEFSVAAGVKYEITETFFGEVRYTYGFSNIISDDNEIAEDSEAKSRTLAIGIGINL